MSRPLAQAIPEKKTRWWFLQGRSRRRWSFRIARIGWVYFAITFAIGLAALNTGNNLLYLVLGMMCSFITISGILSEITLSRIRCTPIFPEHIHALQQVIVTIDVENRKRIFPSFCLRIGLVAEAGSEVSFKSSDPLILSIGRKSTTALQQKIVVTKRGEFHLRGYTISTDFPFGFLHKGWLVNGPVLKVIYPALLEDTVVEDFLLRAQLGRSRRKTFREGEISHLRDMTPGDNYRMIHWKASAKLDRFVVKVQEGVADRARILALILVRTEDESIGEKAISLAATIIDGFRREETDFLFYLNANSIGGLKSFTGIMRRLALVDRDDFVSAGEAGKLYDRFANEALIIGNVMDHAFKVT